MYELWFQVLKDSLIMRDQEDSHFWSSHAGDDLSNLPDCINVQSGISFIHDRDGRFEYCHLKDLCTFLFAAGKSLVQVALRKSRIHLNFLQPLLKFLLKCESRDHLSAYSRWRWRVGFSYSSLYGWRVSLVFSSLYSSVR